MSRLNLLILLSLLLVTNLSDTRISLLLAQEIEQTSSAEVAAVVPKKNQDEAAPTYITSEKLFVDNVKRTFTYSGDVKVKRADLTITAQTMTGFYDENNQITTMIAKGDVFITSAENVTASSQEAHYDAVKELLTLTKSPELQQDGGIITADIIRIYVEENRSEADGEVRLRLPEDPKP